ncbi:hypothetical protein CK203_076683 [Vitis vinifera]|uniref:Uncharacterized protein n=1 Tax=Vitis vinifera TaxID=29760 RepID=A0A438EPH2_VITVI|nr:hypothetical protein CK203_076683 [Vitis vinifera]
MATIASLRFFSRLSLPPSHRSRSQLSFDLTHFSPTKNPRKFQTLTLVRASSSSFDDLSSERSANSRSKLGNAYQFLSITRIGTAHDIFGCYLGADLQFVLDFHNFRCESWLLF